MNDSVKKPAAAVPVSTAPPARKAVPPQAAVASPVAPVVAPVASPAPVKAPAKAPVKTPVKAVAARAPRVRKPTQVEQTVAKHQKVLAEELVKAQAINYEQPKVVKAAAPKKTEKPVKAAKPSKAVKPEKPVKYRKPKLVRDSYAMPESEYALIALLKKRMTALGSEVKKSELLRGGIAALAAFNDVELKAVMGRVERIKTGRPAKK